MAQRAAERIGETVDVLVEELARPTGVTAAGPRTRLPRWTGPPRCGPAAGLVARVTWSRPVVTGAEGVDLLADAR